MQKLNRNTVDVTALPIKILQFGEGNFLRAFSDWMVDLMNEKEGYNHGIAVVQPIENGIVDLLANQDGLYHHVIRGLKNGKPTSETRLITAIQKAVNPFHDEKAYWELATSEDLELVISNTTEAGIVFNAEDHYPEKGLAKTFPGKITQLLKARFEAFNGARDKGLKFIPVELIDKNGEKLKEAVLNYCKLWNLSESLRNWIENHNYFANTLVDRIVPGYPKDEINTIQEELGYEDKLVVTSEVFHLWVIEGSKEIQEAFPVDQYGLNVIYTKDQSPYRTRKVRVLNGAHTCMVPIGLLNGLETVREAVEDAKVGKMINQLIFDEILPTIDLPHEELVKFANEVIERFRNPFIKHELKSIALNSISKFKVRVLPTVLDYISSKNELPKGLLFALANLIKLYCSDTFKINDDASVIAYFTQLRQEKSATKDLVDAVLSNTDFWGQDLTQIEGVCALVTKQMEELTQPELLA